MSYESAAQFAETWGLGFLILMFLAAVAYALWPGNRDKFERAARLPLDEADLDHHDAAAIERENRA